MDFTSLPKTLGDFFDSLLPALTQTTVLILFLLFLVGSDPVTRWLKLRLSRLKTPSALATDPFIKQSGILKLVPIGLLVAFLLLGIVVDRTVCFIGFKIPGQLHYTEPDVLVSSVPTDELAKLWALFPAAEDEYMLHLVLEYQVASAPTPANSSTNLPWLQHDERYSAAERAINLVKFYVVFGLVLCLVRKRIGIASRRVWLRYGFVVTAGALLAFFFTSQQIEAKKQSDWAMVNYVVAKQVASGREWELRLADKETQAKFAERLTNYRTRYEQGGGAAFFIRP